MFTCSAWPEKLDGQVQTALKHVGYPRVWTMQPFPALLEPDTPLQLTVTASTHVWGSHQGTNLIASVLNSNTVNNVYVSFSFGIKQHPASSNLPSPNVCMLLWAPPSMQN